MACQPTALLGEDSEAMLDKKLAVILVEAEGFVAVAFGRHA